jgi:hypothetical protein
MGFEHARIEVIGDVEDPIAQLPRLLRIRPDQAELVDDRVSGSGRRRQPSPSPARAGHQVAGVRANSGPV